MRVLVTGYYGQSNFGDDLIMKIVVSHLLDANVRDIVVSSSDRGVPYIRKWFPEVDTINLHHNDHKVYSKFDKVLFGGGGVIFEYRDNLPIMFVTRRLIADYMRYGRARSAGTRFGGIGIGIGPFSDFRSKIMSMNVLKYMDMIYVRDDTSYEYAKAMVGSRAHVSWDLSLSEYESIRRSCTRPQNAGRVVFLIRHVKYGEHGNSYLPAFMQAAEVLERDGKAVVWASYQPAYDAPVIDRLEELGKQVWKWDPLTMSVGDAYGLTAGVDCVVTARMHALYVAAMGDVPAVGVAIAPKLDHAATSFGDAVRTVSGSPSLEELMSAYEAVVSARPNQSQRRMEKMSRDVRVMLEDVTDWITS